VRRSYLPRCGAAEELRRKPQLEKRMRNAPPIEAAAAAVVTKQRSSSPSSWLSLSKLLPRQILQLPSHIAATNHRLCVMGCLSATLRLSDKNSRFIATTTTGVGIAPGNCNRVRERERENGGQTTWVTSFLWVDGF
jgi:hypothetical protein